MDGFKSLDLFSGIGGFALAAERAGIETAAFCEIDKFPQSVLKYRYPDIPVIDDVRKLTKESFKSATGLDYVDIVCGGSPLKPKFAVWENVPGALSSNGGRDFESVLCAFTGHDGIEFTRWGNAGYFKGRDGFYNVAYRILDSRFFGVPQRRRRVFLVASLGDDSCAEILFEQARLRGNFASGENEEQDIAAATERGFGGLAYQGLGWF